MSEVRTSWPGDNTFVFKEKDNPTNYSGTIIPFATNQTTLKHVNDIHGQESLSIEFVRYPTALYRRAEVDSVLDWHHSNLRSCAVGYFRNAVLAPAVGLPLNPQAVAEDEKVLLASLEKIESFWLQKNGRFLLGNDQPSIADLSLVCEIMQLEVLDEKDHDRILGPYKSILKWIDNTKNATEPHFHEVHGILFKFKEKLLKQRSVRGSRTTESSRTPDLQAKI